LLLKIKNKKFSSSFRLCTGTGSSPGRLNGKRRRRRRRRRRLWDRTGTENEVFCPKKYIQYLFG
jgi:hypothetical protein